MLKINLALKKQALDVEEGGKTSLQVADFLEVIKDPDIRKFATALVVCYASVYVTDKLKADDLKEVQTKIDAIETQKNEAEKRLSEIKKFEQLKNKLSADEETIREKLGVIRKVSENRDLPAKILKEIAQTIPSNAWITSLESASHLLKIKGGAIDPMQVSEFMKSLNSSAYFTDVKLVNQSTANDPRTQTETVIYELSLNIR